MIDIFDYKTMLGIAVALAVIAIYRFYFQKKSPEEKALEKEYQEVLTLDKYKVKGQW